MFLGAKMAPNDIFLWIPRSISSKRHVSQNLKRGEEKKGNLSDIELTVCVYYNGKGRVACGSLVLVGKDSYRLFS